MQFAESVGYPGFCMTEQHRQLEGIEPTTNPLFWDYCVAQHTQKRRVGQVGMHRTGVNPLQLAENIALLDHCTNGRVFAGFSRGNTPRWTATFGQHIEVTATASDQSAADQRHRAVFDENWQIVKALWTQDTVPIDGDFWKVPTPVTWDFTPTTQWAPGTVGPDKTLQAIGIVPRPYQQPHPPVYYPFSQSMETVRFWGREGGKMVAFIADAKEDFISIAQEQYMKAAESVGRKAKLEDAFAIGGHLVLGRTAAESQDIQAGFEELFNMAYNAPPYHVPMGRLWKGSRHEVQDEVTRLVKKFKTNEIFLWHHVGYFPQEVELAMLSEFAEAVIKPLSTVTA
jgi:alkanesulfonate monooxygenase SsuD/methylene tetrahydromethanopterin reductase-like flavin-dependent oxidoreductase (luciferase family)